MVRLKHQGSPEGLGGIMEDGTRRSTRIAKNREVELQIMWLKDGGGVLQPFACVDKPGGDVDPEDHMEAVQECIEAQEKAGGGWWMYDFEPYDDHPPKKPKQEKVAKPEKPPKPEKAPKAPKPKKAPAAANGAEPAADGTLPVPSGDVDAVIVIKGEQGVGIDQAQASITAKQPSGGKPKSGGKTKSANGTAGQPKSQGKGTGEKPKPTKPAVPFTLAPPPIASSTGHYKPFSSMPMQLSATPPYISSIPGQVPLGVPPQPTQLSVAHQQSVQQALAAVQALQAQGTIHPPHPAQQGLQAPQAAQPQQTASQAEAAGQPLQQPSPLPPAHHQLQQLPPRNAPGSATAAAPAAATPAAPGTPTAAPAAGTASPAAATPQAAADPSPKTHPAPRTHVQVPKCCSNCGVTATSAWRRTKDTRQLVCNSCGDYYRRNGRHRRITGGPVRLGPDGTEEVKPPAYATAVAAQQAAAAASGSATSSSPAGGLGPGSVAIPPRGAVQLAGPDDGVKRCSNCGNDKTPTWRRDAEGSLLCNACGLYYRSMGRHRPVALVSRLNATPFGNRGGGGSGNSSGGEGAGGSTPKGPAGIKRFSDGDADASNAKRASMGATGLVLAPDGTIGISMGAGLPPAPLAPHQLTMLQQQIQLQQQMQQHMMQQNQMQAQHVQQAHMQAAMQAQQMQHMQQMHQQQMQQQDGQQMAGLFMGNAFVDGAGQEGQEQQGEEPGGDDMQE